MFLRWRKAGRFDMHSWNVTNIWIDVVFFANNALGVPA